VRDDGTTQTHYYYAGDHLVETRDTASPPRGTQGDEVVTAADRPATAVQYQYVWSPVYVDTPILRDVYKYDGIVVQMQGTSSTSTGVSGRLYYMTDANANVTALADPTGQVQERYSYDAFGKATVYDAYWSVRTSGSAAGNTRLFAGEQLDAKTGLYYDRARWYDSSTGGFISRDPAEADVNLYRYAGNDPTGMVDPSGMADVPGDDGSGYTGGTGGSSGNQNGAGPTPARPTPKGPCDPKPNTPPGQTTWADSLGVTWTTQQLNEKRKQIAGKTTNSFRITIWAPAPYYKNKLGIPQNSWVEIGDEVAV